MSTETDDETAGGIFDEQGDPVYFRHGSGRVHIARIDMTESIERRARIVAEHPDDPADLQLAIESTTLTDWMLARIESRCGTVGHEWYDRLNTFPDHLLCARCLHTVPTELRDRLFEHPTA